MAARRAVRRRPRGGQPQPGRARVLRRVDAAVHAGIAVAGGRTRARGAGGRGEAARRGHERRLRAVPACGRDAVQPGAGGEAIMTTMATELAATREQSRARYPDEEGYVERDGVRLHYEVYGD